MIKKYRACIEERAREDIDCSAGPDGCWLWVGTLSVYGYGVFNYGGKLRYAHRVSYEMEHGPIPDGMQIRHKCDVRNCCNPQHLEPGTIADNMADKVARGRHLRGDTSPVAKLTDAEVREIRRRRAAGETLAALARDYGCTDSNICAITRSRSRLSA